MARMDEIKGCRANADGPHNFQMTPHDGMLLLHCTQCGKTAALMQEQHTITKKIVGAFWQILDFAPAPTTDEREATR